MCSLYTTPARRPDLSRLAPAVPAPQRRLPGRGGGRGRGSRSGGGTGLCGRCRSGRPLPTVWPVLRRWPVARRGPAGPGARRSSRGRLLAAVDLDVVAVEDVVVARPLDPPGAGGDQAGLAAGHHVEALVDPAARSAARRTRRSHRAPSAGPATGEGVAVEEKPAGRAHAAARPARRWKAKLPSRAARPRRFSPFQVSVVEPTGLGGRARPRLAHRAAHCRAGPPERGGPAGPAARKR